MNPVIIVILGCVLLGCSNPTDFAEQPVTNAAGQTITFVREEILHGWLTEHKSIRIVSLSGYGAGTKTYGGYIVVYEPLVERPR